MNKDKFTFLTAVITWVKLLLCYEQWQFYLSYSCYHVSFSFCAVMNRDNYTFLTAVITWVSAFALLCTRTILPFLQMLSRELQLLLCYEQGQFYLSYRCYHVSYSFCSVMYTDNFTFLTAVVTWVTAFALLWTGTILPFLQLLSRELQLLLCCEQWQFYLSYSCYHVSYSLFSAVQWDTNLLFYERTRDVTTILFIDFYHPLPRLIPDILLFFLTLFWLYCW
jgi:hypothetical protein